MELIKRHFKEPKQNYFLFGPRGTGKSTYLNLYHKNALVIDLLKPDVYRRYKAKPERLIDLIQGNPERKTIIIDEIQKVPELLDPTHKLIEEKPGHQFILTGSSARKIKQKDVNLLAGRAISRSLHPFTASELKERFQLERALQTGMIPLVVSSSNPQETLAAYIDLYMREEIQTEGLVRNIGNFARFLEAISFSHGSVLNVTNVARECGVKRKTVEGYIEILYDLLMAFSLPVFSRKAKRAVVQHPKFYFFDTGVFRTLRPSGPLDSPGETEGTCLEGMVAQHLRAWIDYSQGSYNLYYWRTKSGTEIDFIVYGNGGFWAVEVKNKKEIRDKDLRPLIRFHQDYPECQPIFVYRGTEKLHTHNILCIPCESFLKSLHHEQPLPLVN